MSTFKHYLMIFLVSMVPLIELRGAIPYAIGFIEAGEPLNLTMCYLIAIVGNMLPVPFIYLLPSVLRRERRADRSSRPKQEEDYIMHCFYLLVSHFRVRERGQEHWQHQYLIWISGRAYLL